MEALITSPFLTPIPREDVLSYLIPASVLEYRVPEPGAGTSGAQSTLRNEFRRARLVRFGRGVWGGWGMGMHALHGCANVPQKGEKSGAGWAQGAWGGGGGEGTQLAHRLHTAAFAGRVLQKSHLHRSKVGPIRATSEKSLSVYKYPETHILHDHEVYEKQLELMRPHWAADREIAAGPRPVRRVPPTHS